MMNKSNNILSRGFLLKVGAWFFCAIAILFMLISLRYTRYMSIDSSFLAWIYITITTISHFILLAFIPYILLYLPIILLFPRKRVATTTAVAITTVATTLLITDTLIFDLYRFHINLFTLEMLFGGAANQVFVFDFSLYLKSFLAIAVIALLMWLIFKLTFRLGEKRILRKGRLVGSLIILFLMASHSIHAWAAASYYQPVLQVSCYYPCYYPLQANKLLYKWGIVDADKSRQNMYESETSDKNNLSYPIHQIEYSTSAPKPNILLIVIDSWHHNTFNEQVTPNIYNFSKNCSVFNNHFSGSNGTRGGLFALFYSIPALYWYDILAAQKGCAFIDYLVQRDYTIKTFASASLINPPFERTIFRNVKNLTTQTEGETAWKRDEQITENWLTFTKEYSSNSSKNPFFGFLFYDLPHAFKLPSDFVRPFNPSWAFADYLNLNNDSNPEQFFNLYKNCLYYDDLLVGKILDDLKSKNLLDNTLVIITSDHGQEFNDNHQNYWGHGSNYSQTQIKVPFIFWGKGAPSHQFKHKTTHYDVVPTLMESYLGVKNPISDYSIGKQLTDSTKLKWLFVGTKEDFGILYDRKILSIKLNRNYTITDSVLNKLNNEPFNAEFMNNVLKEVNRFYK